MTSMEKAAGRKHPEDTCQRCGGFNPAWTADNELFNKVNGSPNGIMCPTCFANMAQGKGIEIKFIAGWQEQDKEIERLKAENEGHKEMARARGDAINDLQGHIERLTTVFERAYKDFLRDAMNGRGIHVYEDQLENSWQQTLLENKL